MMKEIKKINKISLANIVAMIYGVIGFFASVCVFVFSFTQAIVESGSRGSVIGFVFFNIGITILFALIVSIITAIIGWLIGLLIAIFYNMFALRLGGIKIELEDVYPKNNESSKVKESDLNKKDKEIDN